MAKLVIRNGTYSFLNLVYKSLCLAGLLYQVVQISVNYFQFDVVTNIAIIVPKLTHDAMGINLCFLVHQMNNESIWNRLVRERYKSGDGYTFVEQSLTLRDRFNMAIPPNELFPEHGEKVNIFITSGLYCYQIRKTKVGELFTVKGSYLQKVQFLSTSMSELLPNADLKQAVFQTGSIIWNETVTFFWISYQYFAIEKLQWPFIDNCFDYTQIGFDNQMDAIAKCFESTLLSKNHVYGHFIYQESDERFMNSSTTIDEDDRMKIKECESKFILEDCKTKHIFIQTQLQRMTGVNINSQFIIATKGAHAPSQKIVSKPRIDHVDFVTFIFGTLGTWIGFSFVLINPIPFFFQKYQSQISNHSNRVSNSVWNESSNRSHRIELIAFKKSMKNQNELIRKNQNTLQDLLARVQELECE